MNFYEHHPGNFDVGMKIHKLPMVYVIATKDFKYLKIGSTKSFKRRLSNIQSGCPFHLSLWMCIRTTQYLEVEKHLLDAMTHSRLRGEWFEPSDKDISFISDFCMNTNAHIRKVVDALF